MYETLNYIFYDTKIFNGILQHEIHWQNIICTYHFLLQVDQLGVKVGWRVLLGRRQGWLSEIRLAVSEAAEALWQRGQPLQRHRADGFELLA